MRRFAGGYETLPSKPKTPFGADKDETHPRSVAASPWAHAERWTHVAHSRRKGVEWKGECAGASSRSIRSISREGARSKSCPFQHAPPHALPRNESADRRLEPRLGSGWKALRGATQAVCSRIGDGGSRRLS